MNKLHRNIIRRQAQAMRKAAHYITPAVMDKEHEDEEDKRYDKLICAANNRIFCDQYSGRVHRLSDNKAAALFRLQLKTIRWEQNGNFPAFRDPWCLKHWGNVFSVKETTAIFFGHDPVFN